MFLWVATSLYVEIVKPERDNTTNILNVYNLQKTVNGDSRFSQGLRSIADDNQQQS